MKGPRPGRALAAVLALVAVASLTGCAALSARRRPAGVPVESRPTPPPPVADTVATAPVGGDSLIAAPPRATGHARSGTGSTAPAGAATTASPPVQAMMSPEERRATLERIVADTTTAGVAVRKCVGKTLLPDQESVFETARTYLAQVRAAIARGELWSAEGLARKARQLAASLECH